MSQDDYLFERLTKESERAKINQVLAAIVTNNSGDTEPTTTYPFQFWADTTTGLLKIRNAANNAWVTVGTLASAYLGMALAGAIESSGLTIGSGKIAGRSSASTGALEQLSLSQVLDLIGSAAQGDILYRGASGWERLGAGVAYNLLQMNSGATAPEWGSAMKRVSPITMATGSPTYIDVTGIPSGVSLIHLSFKGYSTNGTSVGIIQLGDSGGPENSGYEGTTQIGINRLAHSSGFAMSYSASAAFAMRGTIVLTRLDSGGTEWMAVGQLTVDAGANGIYQIVGNKTLTGELTQIRWTTAGGTDAADGGTMYVSYM